MNFQLSNQEQEPALRKLVRGSPMPGWIRLAFGREPDFFHATGVQGKTNQVLVAMEGARVVGMGCRSIRPAWVNGRKADIGYLGGLRLSPEVRRTGALARGYAALKRLHDEAPVPVYLTTVLEGNTAAASLLSSGRAGLPHYLDRGRFFTYAISLNQRRRRLFRCDLEIRHGGDVGLARITAFLTECGSRRQFFPAIDAADFGTNYLRGLNPEAFRVVMRGNGEIAGVAAVWDQNHFKQNIVEGYAPVVQVLRPIINGTLRVAGFRPLPAAGGALRMLYVAFCCIRQDDPHTLRALLERIYTDCQPGNHYLLVLGMHERDPLRAALDGFLTYRYTSRLYLVCWDDGLEFVRQLDPTMMPHIETATL
jgi:hypothetical protein